MSASAPKASLLTMTSRPAPVSPPFTFLQGRVPNRVYRQRREQHVLLCLFSLPHRETKGKSAGDHMFSKAVNVTCHPPQPRRLADTGSGTSLGFGLTGADYCLLSNHGCEYSCVNTDKSFACQCPEGHVLQSDGKTCASESHYI